MTLNFLGGKKEGYASPVPNLLDPRNILGGV